MKFCAVAAEMADDARADLKDRQQYRDV